METTLIELLVPGYILDHFEFERVETISGVIRIHLVEKKDPDRSVATLPAVSSMINPLME